MLYLDMDGVISDFHTAYFRLAGVTVDPYSVKTWEIQDIAGHTEDQMWDVIRAAGEEFWTDMPAYHWANLLYRELRRVDEVRILTSVSPRVPAAWSGKIKWLQQHMKPVPKVILIEKDKYLLAQPGTVLIDDKPENIRQFMLHGGHAITFPQAWNSPAEDCADPVQTTLDRLTTLPIGKNIRKAAYVHG